MFTKRLSFSSSHATPLQIEGIIHNSECKLCYISMYVIYVNNVPHFSFTAHVSIPMEKAKDCSQYNLSIAILVNIIINKKMLFDHIVEILAGFCVGFFSLQQCLLFHCISWRFTVVLLLFFCLYQFSIEQLFSPPQLANVYMCTNLYDCCSLVAICAI